MEFAKNDFTVTVSAPRERRYAAASKVRTPALKTNSFVSSIIPDIKAVAQTESATGCLLIYCKSSVTISHVEEACGS